MPECSIILTRKDLAFGPFQLPIRASRALVGVHPCSRQNSRNVRPWVMNPPRTLLYNSSLGAMFSNDIFPISLSDALLIGAGRDLGIS